MPTFRVTDPQTGATLRLTGDSPPTEQELEQIFASVGAQPEAQDGVVTAGDAGAISPAGQRQQGIGDQILGGVAAAGQIAGEIIREPIKGLIGIGGALLPGEEGQGVRAMQAFEQQAPQLIEGTAAEESLQAVGEAIAPVGEAISAAETGLGEAAFEATGSPTAAAAATAIPTALLEAVGLGAGGRVARGAVKPSKRAIDKAIRQAAPEAETIKNTSRAIYRELDDSGIKVKPAAYNQLVSKVRRAAREQGLDARITPKAAGALDAMEDVLGSSPSLTEVDVLRKLAGNVAKAPDAAEAALGVRMISEIDDFLDRVPSNALTKGDISSAQVGAKYRAARDLWGRARKSELLQEAVENAKDVASGFENGIRIELRKIARNKKLSKFFTDAEKAAIKDVVRGNPAQNFAKLIGRFGFSEGGATNVLTALSGVGLGGVAGGGIGAFAVPAVGTASRQVAQKLTRGRAAFVDSVVRAGSDGKKVAEAYLNTVPKASRSVDDLSRLLSDPAIDTKGMIKSSNSLIRQATEIAEGRKIIGAAAGAAVPSALREDEI